MISFFLSLRELVRLYDKRLGRRRRRSISCIFSGDDMREMTGWIIDRCVVFRIRSITSVSQVWSMMILIVRRQYFSSCPHAVEYSLIPLVLGGQTAAGTTFFSLLV
jgi:hypothetical protein